MALMEQKNLNKRIILIIRCLSQRRRSNNHPTLDDLMDYVNEHSDFKKDVSQRSMERTLEAIRDMGITINVEQQNGKYVYILDKRDELPLVEEDGKADFGVLLRLINTHEELDSVQWLKSTLIRDYGMREEHFENDEFFVLPKPNIRDHDKILKLAMELVRYAKAGKVVQFMYLPKNPDGPIELKVVAPMQVRQYDGRYYLAAVGWRENKEPFKTLTMYALDKIQDQVVSPALQETDDEDASPFEELPPFNYAKYASAVGLKDYFTHCIGVTRPDKKEPKLIRLEFTDWARTHVLNNPIHHSQKIIENGDKLVITIFAYDTFELDYVLARYREHCRR